MSQMELLLVNCRSAACIVFVVVSTLLLGSCSKTGTPALPDTASYAGQVLLYDEFGASESSGEGVTVTDEANRVSTITNAAGEYTLTPLRAQTARTISFSKAGYGTYRQTEVIVSGATQAQAAVKLARVSPLQFGQSSGTNDGYTEVYLYGTYWPIAYAQQPRPRRVFFKSGGRSASPVDYDVTLPLPSSRLGSLFADTLRMPELLAAGAVPGNYYGYAIYGDNPAASTYRDPASGKQVYPAVSTGLAATGVVRLP